jgi:hypothetical protein
MQARTSICQGALISITLMVAGCAAPPPAPPAPPPPPAPAPAPTIVYVPVPSPQSDPADLAARRFLAYHDQLRQMSPADVTNEINRLNAVVSATATAAPADSVLELALALAQQRNGGDVARAIALLEPITKSSAPEMQPWQGLARLLLARVLEQRRLEDLLAREVAQRRDQQRNLQQLNEKLEALKAIERSMTTRSPGANNPPAAGAPPAPPAASAQPPAPAPKAP